MVSRNINIIINSQYYYMIDDLGYRIYDSVECYDTQKDQWSYVASMRTKRCRLGLAALNGKLYAAGGYDSLNFLNTVERYCPVEDKWEFVASMNFKRRSPQNSFFYLCVCFFLNSD